MKVRASSLDDLLNDVFRRLITTGQEIHPGKGKAYEIRGVVLELSNPRARMSRTEARALIFSWLGELLWYLAGSDELKFIRYYLKDYPTDYKGATTVRAAYGPRLRDKQRDQLKWVIDLLKAKPDTRRAVIPIFQPRDAEIDHPEVPCTCTLQFLLRNRRLEMIAHMRSNDAYIGLPGDIFAFTMIQELVAAAMNVQVGRYRHLVGSLHLYEAHRKKAQQFLSEGFQDKTAMPIMPSDSPFSHLDRLLRFERAMRLGKHPKVPGELPIYWQDLATLLWIFRAADKEKANSVTLRKIRKLMHSDAYSPYIEVRQRRAEKRDALAPVASDRLLFDEAPNA